MHSSAFRLAVFGFVFASAPIFSGIEDLTILVSPDGKQFVVLAGDIHDRHPGTQTERLAHAIATLQEQDPTPLQVGIEIPGNLFKDSPCITSELAPTLEALNIPQLKIEDCEVRTVSGLALWLFSKQNPEQVCPITVLEVGGKECIVGEATFDDLNSEFEEVHGPLNQFAQTLPDLEKERFQLELLFARNQLKQFQSNIKPFMHTSNTILQAAIRFARYERTNPRNLVRQQMVHFAFQPFSTLLNLSMIKSVLSKNYCKQLFLTGVLHAQAIKEFFQEINWKKYPKKDAHQFSQNPDALCFGPIFYIKSTTEE